MKLDHVAGVAAPLSPRRRFMAYLSTIVRGSTEETLRINGFLILPIEPRHAAALMTLHFHHRGPFDRLIITQTIIEQIPVVSTAG